MQRKDYLIVALVPLALLLIPLVGNMTVEGWHWIWTDFVMAWAVFTATIFFFRLLATRKFASRAYRIAAGLSVVTGFLITWITMAVQIIGEENPANIFYLGVILIGLAGVGLARFRPAGMAKAAFATAAATFLVPVIAVLLWPANFSPGIPQVFMLNGGFVLMFVVSGFLFRRAAGQNSRSNTAATA